MAHTFAHEKQGILESGIPCCDILEAVTDCVYVCDINGNVIYINQTMCKYLGMNDIDLRVFDWKQFVHPEDVPRAVEQWGAAMERDPVAPYDNIIRIKRHDDIYRRFKTSVNALPNLHHKYGRLYVGTSMDIENQLWEKEERYLQEQLIGTILDQLPVAVLVIDRNSEVILCNTKMNDWWPSKNVEKNIQDLQRSLSDFPWEDWPLVKSLQTGETITDFLYTKNNRTVLISSAPVYDKQNEIRYGAAVTQDITERLQAEEEKNIALEKQRVAQEASKLKSIFLANMSHEIRTPLHGIMGMLSVLMTEIDKPNVKSDLEEVQNSARSLLTIIDDIMDLSEIEADKMIIDSVPFDLHKLLQEVMDAFYPASRSKKLSLELVTEPDLPRRVSGDPKRLRQCLSNLISNAIKFTDSGRVILRVYKESIIDESHLLTCFSVSDTGIGMSEETIQKIFEPFEQGDVSNTRIYGGAGLGLTITKRLLHLMNKDLSNGDIRVESSLGKGSTFTFRLLLQNLETSQIFTHVGKDNMLNVPCQMRDSSNSSEPEVHVLIDNPSSHDLSDETIIFRPEKVRILLVEDNDLNRSIATRLLQKYKFQVDSAVNGYRALEMIREHNNYDIILLDIQMPVMDGYETATELRKNGYKKPIIALTANAIDDDRLKALESGMDDFITKPFDVQKLLPLIRNWYLKRYTSFKMMDYV